MPVDILLTIFGARMNISFFIVNVKILFLAWMSIWVDCWVWMVNKPWAPVSLKHGVFLVFDLTPTPNHAALKYGCLHICYVRLTPDYLIGPLLLELKTRKQTFGRQSYTGHPELSASEGIYEPKLNDSSSDEEFALPAHFKLTLVEKPSSGVGYHRSWRRRRL